LLTSTDDSNDTEKDVGSAIKKVFRKWPKIYFGTQVHFHNIYVTVEYQGHGVKVKVVQDYEPN